MTCLVGLTAAELGDLAVSLGEPRFRGRQLRDWIYRRGAASFDLMSDLSAGFRGRLAADHCLRSSSVADVRVAGDGAAKLLVRLHDGETVECVHLPYAERVSVCLSSQVGCAIGCRFCATAVGGLARNLMAGEIVEQLLLLQERDANRPITHVVFMGMGEPLLNVDEVVRSMAILISDRGISPRRITLSTVGIVPGISELAQSGLGVNLALSLHAATDEKRTELIPTARRWPIAEVLEACRKYREATGRDVTYEYLLLAGVNDSLDDAIALVRLLRGMPGTVNLIPYNRTAAIGDYHRPLTGATEAFKAELERSGRSVTRRMERGTSVAGACGQLRRSRQKER